MRYPLSQPPLIGAFPPLSTASFAYAGVMYDGMDVASDATTAAQAPIVTKPAALPFRMSLSFLRIREHAL